jgi:hypothetical protein
MISVVCQKSESSPKKHVVEVPDDTNGVLDAVAEHSFDCMSIADHSGIFKQYRTGRLYFHVHFSWLRNDCGQIKAHDLCAIYRRLPFSGIKLNVPNFPVGECEDKRGGPELRYNWSAMRDMIGRG